MENKILKFFKLFHSWISKSEQIHRIAQKSMIEIEKSLDFLQANLPQEKMEELANLIGIEFSCVW